MLKKITAILTAVALIIPITSNAKAIYEQKTVTNVASGIVLTNSVRLDDAGWQNINIIEADLSNPYVKTKILTSPEMNKLATVKKLATDNNTTVAVNGDFFAWKSGETGKGSVLGTIMKDGELLSSSSETEGMYTFAIDNFNKIICEHIKTNITLTAPNGEILTIKHLNKYDTLAEPVIYTSDFMSSTDGSYDNILEVVIENDIVTDMRQNLEGVSIPENGYVIRHLPEFNPFLIENLKVGDKIEISFEANVNLADYKSMTGGGTMLVTAGQLAKNTHNIAGANPRTVIACDETRTKLYLITVDGRQDEAKGYTLAQLAEYLMEIGMYDAMNLDGGGSTTMVINDKGSQKVVNMPSEGSLRAVASGIGVVSDGPKGDTLAGFDIVAEDYNVFAGTSRTFEIVNPYDEYGNPYNGELPQIEWSIEEGYGYFTDNILHAEKQGTDVSVYASYDGYTVSEKINILNDLHSIVPTPSHFSSDKYNVPEFVVKGITSDGVSVKIENKDVNVTGITAFEKNVQVLDKSATITFSEIIEDFEKDSYTASGYPAEITAEIINEHSLVKSGKQSAKLSYNFLNSPNDKNAAAYLDFKNPINVSGKNKLGVWVYSPTQLNQWLRAEFQATNGEVIRETLSEKTDFSGWKYITFDVPYNAEKLSKLYVVQNSDKEKSKGYVIFDSLSVFGQDFKSELNSIQGSEQTVGDITFGVVAGMPKTKTLLTNLLASKTANTLKDKNYIFSLSGYDFNSAEEIKVTGYSSFVKDNNLFVTVNNSDGYTSAAQWRKFTNDTKSGFKNLFVFLNESPKLIKNDSESKMFSEMLVSISKNANVFVFYPDMHTYSYKSDGATFVSVGALNVTSPKSASMFTGKKYMPTVAIQNGNATLTFVNMY